jgi:phosphomannomutase
MSNAGLMISVSGVRGRVGEALTPEVIATYAAAFGAWAKQNRPLATPTRPHDRALAAPTRPHEGALAAPNRPEATSGEATRSAVVVGRDSRVSGPMFNRVVIAALQSVGCDVIDVGLAPTPTIQLAVEWHHAAGGLAITASHNPIEWNALKFIAPSGLFLSSAEGAEMRTAMAQGIPRATWDCLGQVTSDPEAISRHIEAILALPYVDVPAMRRRRFHVALDCVRGAGATIMPELLDRLGCRVTAINLETDGRFPRPPEPGTSAIWSGWSVNRTPTSGWPSTRMSTA